MAEQPSIVDTRSEQMFPKLLPDEIERLRRFGEIRRYGQGAALWRLGETGHGLTVILSGAVVVTRRDGHHRATAIVTHDVGSFAGELGQLTGQPTLVEAHAEQPAEALIIPPERLRAVMVAEAELGERIMRALILRRVGLIQTGAGGPVIIGREDNADVRRLITFLSRNGHPHLRLDPATDEEAATLVARFHAAPADLPIVLCPGGEMLRNPSENQLARCIGLVAPIDPDRLYDVVVVGAGPAGLAAAVYAGSEGLTALVLDCRAFGGQAGASARIENYLGFPTGITGMALMARAYNQARKFGVEMAIPAEASRLEREPSGNFVLHLAPSERVRARTVVLAPGARYRRLDVTGLEDIEATSVHYWASPLEGRLCAHQEVVLVGGGNSAGQAAVFLSGRAAKVWMLVRGSGLAASMSRYLVDRISGIDNIELVPNATVSALEHEDGLLDAVRWRDVRTGEETQRSVRHLFLFIGADPNTDWLAGAGVALDAKGFIRTGRDAGDDRGPFETSFSGVFAIGDVRCGSVKRVAAAVGEGAQAVAAVHAYLADRVKTSGALAAP
ncbi:MAG TPA: FAD-dependent oxidoreductase [Acetobacteraceae bacterium]|nr:FAD-dependent oxidoreductase [Acetobacteraceae bacterium]